MSVTRPAMFTGPIERQRRLAMVAESGVCAPAVTARSRTREVPWTAGEVRIGDRLSGERYAPRRPGFCDVLGGFADRGGGGTCGLFSPRSTGGRPLGFCEKSGMLGLPCRFMETSWNVIQWPRA